MSPQLIVNKRGAVIFITDSGLRLDLTNLDERWNLELVEMKIGHAAEALNISPDRLRSESLIFF